MITEFSDQEMDKHKSMLLIGAGKTNKYLKEIVRPEYVQEAGEVFGTCALVSMYELLISGHEEEDIFLMNIEDKYDYLLIAPLLSEYDFSYIIPLDIFLSDYFFDSLNDGKRTYYLKQVIKQTAGKNHTIFLVTDKHASLYQNMDLFLDEMHQNETKFRGSSDFSLVKENLIFVANNLQEVPWGNVWLARMILNTEANEYPQDPVYQKAVFHIDFTDNIGSMCYFQDHADRTCSIENLLNFGDEGSPLKIFTIYRICLYISKELDFKDYIGSHYVPYKKQQIENIVTTYLESLVGSYLIAYEIYEVYAELNPYHAGTVDIILRYGIQPIGCSERFITRMVRA